MLSPNYDDLFDAHVSNSRLECVSVDSIATTNHKPRRGISGKCLNDLLRGRFSGRISCNVALNNHATVMMENDQSEQDAERCDRNGERVDCDDVTDMVIQERSPSLERRIAMPNHVLVDRHLRNVLTKQD